MTSAYTLFAFAFAFNLFVYFIAGLEDIGDQANKKRPFRQFLFQGAMILLWGWIAWLIQRLVVLIPGGQALFLVVFVLIFLAFRAAFLAAFSRSGDESGSWIGDDVIRRPVIFIPVLLVGYGSLSPLNALLAMAASWAGYGLALWLFSLIQYRMNMEEAEYRLKSQGGILLSIALLSMLILAAFQSFLPRVIQ